MTDNTVCDLGSVYHPGATQPLPKTSKRNSQPRSLDIPLKPRPGLLDVVPVFHPVVVVQVPAA